MRTVKMVFVAGVVLFSTLLHGDAWGLSTRVGMKKDIFFSERDRAWQPDKSIGIVYADILVQRRKKRRHH